MKSQLSAVRITVILFLTVTAALAADWPVFFGPNQDGISTEKQNASWPAECFKPLWRVPLKGYGWFVVGGNKALTMTSREKNGNKWDVCIALDAATGKELWSADINEEAKKLGATKQMSSYVPEKDEGYGPITTPTMNDGRVYVYSLDLDIGIHGGTDYIGFRLVLIP